MDALLSSLAVHGGDDRDARRTAALLLPMQRNDRDELVPLLPYDLEDSIETMIVYLACYMRQSVEYLESQSLDRLHRWFDVVKDLAVMKRRVDTTSDVDPLKLDPT